MSSTGTLVVSDDGVHFAGRLTPARGFDAIAYGNGEVDAIAYGNGIYVAIAGGGRALVSPDGDNWVDAKATGLDADSSRYSQVVSGNGLFVALQGGVLYSSPEGRTWTKRPSQRAIQAIAFGNGRFVGTAISYTTISIAGVTTDPTAVYYSDDGEHWTLKELPDFPPTHGVAFGNGNFLMTVGSQANHDDDVLASVDAVNWKRVQTSSSIRAPGDVLSFSGGLFFRNGDPVLSASADGHDWTGLYVRTTLGCGFIGGGLAKDGRLVIAGDGRLKQSTDGGKVWTLALPQIDASLVGIDEMDGLLVALGEYGELYRSTDGSNWKISQTGLRYPRALAHGMGMFVAVGQGQIFTSRDGSDWSTKDLTDKNYDYLLSIAYGNGTFVALGQQVALYSTNGLDWTLSSKMLYSVSTSGVAYGSGKFIAANIQGALASSVDGKSWTSVYDGDSIVSITYGTAGFVAVRRDNSDGRGDYLTSADGVTWTLGSVGAGADAALTLITASFGSGQYLIGALDGTLYTSPDAVHWTPHVIPLHERIPKAFVSDNKIVIVAGNMILLSTH